MIEPHIKEGTKGHAFPIVCISEGSHVDRAVFNFIAHVFYDRPCETTEEIDEVAEVQMTCNKEIMKLLKAMPTRDYKANPRKFRLTEQP